MVNYNIGICDDELSTCYELGDYIKNYYMDKEASANIEIWTSGRDCCNELKECKISILFLDIELVDINGIDVGNYIRKDLKDYGIQIIFISSKTGYALDLFSIHPFDFIIKPINKENLFHILDSIHLSNETDKRYFSYTKYKEYYRIPMGRIKSIQSIQRHIGIYMYNDEVIEYNGKLKDELKKLSDEFVMVNQSVIVNLKYVAKCSYDHIIMIDGEIMSIGRKYKNTLKEKLYLYNFGKDW